VSTASPACNERLDFRPIFAYISTVPYPNQENMMEKNLETLILRAMLALPKWDWTRGGIEEAVYLEQPHLSPCAVRFSLGKLRSAGILVDGEPIPCGHHHVWKTYRIKD